MTLTAFDVALASVRSSRDPVQAASGAVRRIAGTAAGATWTPTDGGAAVAVDGRRARVVAGVLEVCDLPEAWPVWDGRLTAATAMVTRYAAGAPDAIHDEAVYRVVGWLTSRMPAAAAFQRKDADVEYSVEQAATGVSALRHSGAMALLSPWRVRALQV